MSVDDLQDPTRSEGKSRKAAFAAFSGAFIEWYDFYLYGIASALVFPQLFFADADASVSLMASFGAFAAGFIARPIGALLFGHFGDRHGRKTMLIITVLIMGVCTLLMGLVPTYESIGWWAPAALITLRIVQGLGIGGEFGGGALVALENAPSRKRGLMGSFHQLGTPMGLLVSTGVFSLVQLLPESSFLAWGWRIPFLLSGVFLVFALFLRSSLPETEVFRKRKIQEPARHIPLMSLLREQPGYLLLGLGARMADAVTFNVINVFGIAYATSTLGLSQQMMLTGFVMSAAVQVFLTPLIGMFSDRVGRRPVYMAGIVVCAIGGLAYFPLLSTGEAWVVWPTIIVVQAVGTGLMFTIQGTFFAEMFSTRVRYTSLGMIYQGSALLGGAPTPLIAAALASAFAGSYWGPALYLFAMTLVSLACVIAITETYRSEL